MNKGTFGKKGRWGERRASRQMREGDNKAAGSSRRQDMKNRKRKPKTLCNSIRLVSDPTGQGRIAKSGMKVGKKAEKG